MTLLQNRTNGIFVRIKFGRELLEKQRLGRITRSVALPLQRLVHLSESLGGRRRHDLPTTPADGVVTRDVAATSRTRDGRDRVFCPRWRSPCRGDARVRGRYRYQTKCSGRSRATHGPSRSFHSRPRRGRGCSIILQADASGEPSWSEPATTARRYRSSGRSTRRKLTARSRLGWRGRRPAQRVSISCCSLPATVRSSRARLVPARFSISRCR